MAERNDNDELDEAVDALMADASLPNLDPRLADLLRVAADLRDLPGDAFRARLGAELAGAAAAPRGGKPLITGEDIEARLKEMARESRFVAYDPRLGLADLPELSMRFFTAMDQTTIGVSRFSSMSHWERHPAGDELLHFLEGDAEIVTLTDDGPTRTTVHAGSLFVCPKGLWHQIRPLTPVSLFFATPGAGIEHASSDDPRLGGRRDGGDVPAIPAHDLPTVIAELPPLAITRDTTAQEADGAVRQLTWLDDKHLVGLMRFSGLTPWERHPDGDELLHALDGDIDVTVLTDDGPVVVHVPSGSVFVCPRGLWHRQLPRDTVTELFVTATKTSQVSFADDPRHP